VRYDKQTLVDVRLLAAERFGLSKQPLVVRAGFLARRRGGRFRIL